MCSVTGPHWGYSSARDGSASRAFGCGGLAAPASTRRLAGSPDPGRGRYDEADGGRLAAAVTYYAFFATFALGLLGFATFGFVLDNPAVLRSVEHYAAENVPSVDVQTLRNARSTAGIIAFIGLPITGWFWVDVLRSSIRRIWRLPEYPGT